MWVLLCKRNQFHLASRRVLALPKRPCLMNIWSCEICSSSAKALCIPWFWEGCECLRWTAWPWSWGASGSFWGLHDTPWISAGALNRTLVVYLSAKCCTRLDNTMQWAALWRGWLQSHPLVTVQNCPAGRQAQPRSASARRTLNNGSHRLWCSRTVSGCAPLLAFICDLVHG